MSVLDEGFRSASERAQTKAELLNEPFKMITVSATSRTATDPIEHVATKAEALALVSDWITKYDSVTISPNAQALSELWRVSFDQAVGRDAA